MVCRFARNEEAWGENAKCTKGVASRVAVAVKSAVLEPWSVDSQGMGQNGVNWLVPERVFILLLLVVRFLKAGF